MSSSLDKRAKAFQDAHVALDLLEQAEGWPNMTRTGLVFDSYRGPVAVQVCTILGVETTDPAIRRCAECDAVAVAQFADVDSKVFIFACGAVVHRMGWLVGHEESGTYTRLISCNWSGDPNDAT